MTHTTIRIEGGLLSPDFLEQVHAQAGQTPADFGLERNRSLVDEISAVWSDVRLYWSAFQRRLERAQQSDGESPTTITREQWVIPLLEALGYRLQFQRRGSTVEGVLYPISHRATPRPQPPSNSPRSRGEDRSREERSDEELEDALPVHIVAYDQALGSRPPAGRGAMSPHALLQDYLNRTEHLWALVTNGRVLRLLRDSSYFSRPSYIEFDLQGMLEGERFDEFIFFYRLAQRSRLPRSREEAAACLLESYHQAALEQGGRIRDGLRQAVAEALLVLGNGFLRHPRNARLRERVAAGTLSERAYFRQLLYTIYRLLFLMVAEERGLIGHPHPASPIDGGGEETGFIGNPHPTSPIDGGGEETGHPPTLSHYQLFSITRLRGLADEPLSAPGRFDDLYLGFRTLGHLMRDEEMAQRLGVPALNGELFSQLDDLDSAHLNNRDFLEAIRLLSYFTPADDRLRRRVNYASLDVEELGSVYESLLDEYPLIHFPAHGGAPAFAFIEGSERKTTGSYYTPRQLVQELIRSALQPVIAERLAAAEDDRVTRRQGERSHPFTPSPPHPVTPSSPKEAALLSLRVVDPACGSGHFLLAAARRIGLELARVRTGEEQPPPEAVRAATRDAITHCIYGVDKNPLAVDLCKVALWIEGHGAGKPLTFLDYRIRAGDSLVGVLELACLDAGIPDEAYTPVTGDDKNAARLLKARNRQEREGQMALFAGGSEHTDLLAGWRPLVDLPEETPAQVRRKREAFAQMQRTGGEWWQEQSACHLWCAPFFAEFTGDPATDRRIPTSDDLRRYRQQPQGVAAATVAYAWQLATRHDFFHWPLEFPDVFAQGGFDVVLGNPPWEHVELKEKEWFGTREAEIADASTGAKRKQMIEELTASNPALYNEFVIAKRGYEGSTNFLRNSPRYPLCGRGRINTYAVFAELVRSVTNRMGCTGVIVPSGIATDFTTQYFFQELVTQNALVSLYDFENRNAIFPGVHRSYKFCLLTLRGSDRDEGDGSRASGNFAPSPAQFVFFAAEVAELNDAEKRFSLNAAEIELLNPNTRTCPIFRSRRDAELTKAIYRRVPVFIREAVKDERGRIVRPEENPWGVTFRQGLFNMTRAIPAFSAHGRSWKPRATGWRATASRAAGQSICRSTRRRCSTTSTTAGPPTSGATSGM